MKIVAVDGAQERALLRDLQLQALPKDRPYNTTRGHWWVVYDKCQPVAFAGVVQSAQWFDAGYLCRAGVLPSHRGQGLQRRLIRVREHRARELGWNWLVTDTRHNPASANNLISCGYRLYLPARPWGHTDAIYWRKHL